MSRDELTDGTYWKEQDECQGCGQANHLRAVQMLAGGRDLLCIDCFEDAVADDRVDPSDERLSGGVRIERR